MNGILSSETMIAQWDSLSVEMHIDEIQRLYRKWIIICVVFAAAGGGIMSATRDPRIIAWGLFLMLTGIINVAVMKLWAHTKLSMLRIVHELQKQHTPGQ